MSQNKSIDYLDYKKIYQLLKEHNLLNCYYYHCDENGILTELIPFTPSHSV